jgi:hypothetical protein
LYKVIEQRLTEERVFFCVCVCVFGLNNNSRKRNGFVCVCVCVFGSYLLEVPL